ncbi:retropepsin-like aspartic protease family protein [endosymbiont of Ridgeia piscesae]|jgi:aspartyl protease family protein|nr:TIGR02281 family clan AA aspartic protease [endosymbiont of Ridgeia piscesae]
MALAVERLVVEALFANKVMVSIDGKRRMLKPGKASPEGVLLISSDSRQALIEVDGKRDTYSLGRHVSSSYSEPERQSAKVWRDETGSFTILGSINGRTVQFLLDTGATAVAMSGVEARRLGIAYKRKGTPIAVGTASGMARAYEVTLREVRVGAITLRGVRGFIIEGNSPTQVLLGMSFLSQLTMQDKGAYLLLESRF